MAQNQIDAEDAAVFALFGLAAAAAVGIADVTLFGHAFSDQFPALGMEQLSIATGVSLLSFGWIAFTNEVGMDDIQNLDDNYYYVVIGTVALIVAVPLIPQVHDFVTSNDAISLAAVMVQSAGAVVVSFKA